MASTKTNLEKVMARLFESVVLGKNHLAIGRGVRDAIMADQVIANACKVFWGMTIDAHLDAAQLIAFKLFDGRAGTMTIEYFLRLSDECADTFQKSTPAEVAVITSTARLKINALEPVLKPLKAKRNRILAHLDPTIVLDPEKLRKETQVTFADLDRAFNTAGQILNEVSVAYRAASGLLELLDGDDFEHAMQLIADAKHHQADMYEGEFSTPAPFPRPNRPKSYLR